MQTLKTKKLFRLAFLIITTVLVLIGSQAPVQASDTDNPKRMFDSQ